MRRYILAVVCIAAAYGGIGWAGEHSRAAEAVLGEDGVQRITIEGGSYYYRPDRIILRAGIPAELTLVKEPGITPHNIVFRMGGTGIDIKKNIETKGTVIRFTPENPGPYPFYCDKKLLFFPDHRSRGMEGVFEVIE